MPSGAEIQHYLTGAWRLMLGREDGLDRLDLSVDGFWNSFFAMVVSLPALAIGWVSVANRLGGAEFGGRVGVLLRLGVIDFVAWVLPLVLLALAARPAGIAHRYIPYVVASNWGSALLIWLMVPVSVIELVFPGAVQAVDALGLLVFIATLVLSWRLTRASIGMGAGVASAVFAGVFAVSLVVILTLQPMFGLSFQ
jgi:hypothetical protein